MPTNYNLQPISNYELCPYLQPTTTTYTHTYSLNLQPITYRVAIRVVGLSQAPIFT